MQHLTRLALAPVAALALTGLAAPALAQSEPLASESVLALAVAHCQPDAEAPLTVDELAPVVLGEADVEVVPGEITAHVVRLAVNPLDPAECTVGVLHRDAQLARVAYEGSATVGGTETLIEIGNLGKGSPVDPTTEVELAGSLIPAADVVEDPAFAVSVVRKALQVVPIAVNRATKDAAAKLLKAETKAAAQLLVRQQKAAGKGHGKAAAAAQRAYDRRIAAAQAQYQRATTPKTVTRPVAVTYTVSGTVALADATE